MAPKKPVALEPGLAYLHISSSNDPSIIANALSDHPSYRLQYLGPVGELEGEHIFQVQNVHSEAVKRNELGGDVLGLVKGIEEVKGASVLETKQRAKRDEF